MAKSKALIYQSIRKGKPSEKWGRKTRGLKRKTRHDRPVAEVG